MATDRFRPYRGEPIKFVEEALLGALWSKQKEILLSVRDNRITAVKSCHDIGKTRTAATAAAWWLSSWDPGEAFVVSTAPTFHQVKALLWREINRIHRDGGLPGRMNQTEWVIGGELVGYGVKPDDENPTAMQGAHARRVLAIADEACGLTKTILDALDTLVSNEDSRILMIGNPDDPTSEFAQICKPGSGAHVISVSAFESPNFTGEAIPDWMKPLLVSKLWVEERRKKWGESSPLWKSKVLGDFPEQTSDGLIPLAAIAAAQRRYEKLEEEERKRIEAAGPCELGVDVARFGLDSTVFYLRKGPISRRVMKYQGRDTMQTVGEIVRLRREFGFTRVKIDDVGLGGGVSDRCNELLADPSHDFKGCEVVRVNVGAGSDTVGEAERFANKRAEINWAIRDRFVGGDIMVDPEDDDLANQAGQMRYETTSRGQVKIESKDDMKKRLDGRSPDDWDAFVLSFAEPTYPGAGLLAFAREAVASSQRAIADRLAGVGSMRLLAPPGISTAYGITGKRYSVGADGCVVVEADDVTPLRAAGFTLPDA